MNVEDWKNLLGEFFDYYEDSVVVIGIFCEFLGVKDYYEFWNNIKEGKESIIFFLKEEFC